MQRKRKSISNLFFLLTVFLLVFEVSGGINETLPTYHWAYHYIDQLKVRGYFETLFILNKPFTRGEIARYLLELQSQTNSTNIEFDEIEIFFITQLYEEFKEEMRVLSVRSKDSYLKGQIVVSPIFKRDTKSNTALRGNYRSQVGFSLSQFLTVATSINYDENLVYDPNYWGKKKWGHAVYSEQGYARLKVNKLEIELGRDFIKWSPGREGNLLISDYARPMDFLAFNVQLKFIKFSYFLANLNKIKLPDSLAQLYKSDFANRYLSAHRLDFRFLNGKMNLGITEALLFGGPERTLDFDYINPFINYFGVVENDRLGSYGTGKGNLFAGIDFDFFPVKNFECWGEILIDDIQVERTGAGDLEPPEWGCILGFQFINPFCLINTNIEGEYTRIANRTYNALDPWEKFNNFNRPIGYYLGNDLDRLDFSINYWPKNNLQIALGFDRMQRGEGRIEKEFDMPWMKYTLGKRYHEPFPSGTVETTTTGEVGIYYHPLTNLMFTFMVNYSVIKNKNNSLGVDREEWSFQTGFWFEWDKKFKIE